MIRILIVTFIQSLFATVFVFGQNLEWQRTYGGVYSDWGRCVEQTSDGGYIITGWISTGWGTSGEDVCLVKTNSSGDTLWIRTYGGPEYDLDEGNSVQQTPDGGYIIGGETWSFSEHSALYLIKTNAFGDTVWTRTFFGKGSAEFGTAQQTSDGGYVLCGSTWYKFIDSSDVYLVKVNSSGDTVWTRIYGGNLMEMFGFVQQTSDGGYILSGYTKSFGVGTDAYLIKTDSLGDTLWTRNYGGNGFESAACVRQTSDGGFIVAGRTGSFGAGGLDVYLIKLNSSGDTIWARTYGGSGDDAGSCVLQTTDKGYIIAGRTNSFGAGGLDFYLIKTDSLGDAIWTGTYGGEGYDAAYSVDQTSDNGFVVVGLTTSFGAGDRDIYLIKIKGTSAIPLFSKAGITLLIILLLISSCLLLGYKKMNKNSKKAHTL